MYDKTIYDLQENTYATIIDFTTNIPQIDKNNHFCDGMHKTITGNKYVSREIYKYFINNSKVLNK